MSVIVLGMEMPADGTKYRVVEDPAGRKFLVEDDRLFERWCLLRPLPEKHRRLIDADAVVDKMWRLQATYQMLDDTRTADKIIRGIYLARQTINEAPTIVEAEGD